MKFWSVRAHELRAVQAGQLAEILRETDLDELSEPTATAGGDNAQLRGIPAIGRGVAGAMPGLRPGDSARRAAARATRI